MSVVCPCKEMVCPPGRGVLIEPSCCDHKVDTQGIEEGGGRIVVVGIGMLLRTGACSTHQGLALEMGMVGGGEHNCLGVVAVVGDSAGTLWVVVEPENL